MHADLDYLSVVNERRCAAWRKAWIVAWACLGLAGALPCGGAETGQGEDAAKAAAEAQAKAQAAELERQARSFFLLLPRQGAKEREERARLAAAIQKLSPTQAPEGWAPALASRHASVARNLEAQAAPSVAAGLLRVLTVELEAAQREALAFIRSNQYAGKESQKKVDELVGEARALWEDAWTAALERNAALREALAGVKELEGFFALYAVPGLPAPANEKSLSNTFNAQARTVWVKPAWLELEKYNQAREYLDEEERAHLKVLNEYRMMLGLAPFESDVRLWAAARGHSRDMLEKKFFDHYSPVPGKRTPAERCLLEGYRAWAGENIYFGLPSGVEAFRAWYGSPNHHKNMVSKDKQIGVGRSADHWTQAFGMEGCFFDGRAVRPPRVEFGEKAARANQQHTAPAHFETAQFALGRKLFPQAKSELQKVLELDPNHAQAKSALVEVDAELTRAAAQGGGKRK